MDRLTDLATGRFQTGNPATARAALQLFGVLAASMAIVFLSHEFSRHGGRVASIWPLNALLLALMMRQPRAHWAAIVATGCAGNLAVNLMMGDTLLTGAALVGANAVEVFLCAHLLKRREDFDITNTPDLLRFIGVAGVIGPAVSALIAAVTLWASRPFFETLGVWFAADALGMLVFAPAFLVLASGTDLWTAVRTRTVEILQSLAVLGLALGGVFSQTSYPLLFLIPPALTLATFRLGIGGAAGGILLTAIVSIALTVAGYGPTQLIDGSETERVITLQAFLAVMSLTTLPIAAAIAQSQRVQAELMAANKRARESEAHYRTLADHSTDIVVRLGPGGVITYVSPSCRVLGYQPEQFIGRSTLDFTDPEDRENQAKRLAALFSGAEVDRTVRREARMRTADGSEIWMEGNPSIVRDADGKPIEIVTSYRNVTQRRSLEDELMAATASARASEARYKALSDISLDMIARTDLDGTIRFVSPSSAVIFGYTPEELLGTKTLSYMHPEDLPGVIAAFNRLIAEGRDAPPRPYRFRAFRKDGACVWLEGIPRVLFDDAGNPVEIQDSVRDVTEREQLARRLEEANVVIKAAAQAKSDFLANMSHELRTPLNSIIGFTRLLLRSTALTPPDKRFVDVIARQGRSLLAIVNDILDFSSIESGGLRLEALSFSVRDTVERCVESLRVQADEKNIALSCAVDDALAPRHVGDSTRLDQVLINLVGNAIKFTPEGAVSVSVRATEPEDGRQALLFEVRDTGIGIPADKIGTLFERFSQVDTSIRRRFGGAGLGLAITRSLVTMMGGEIGVESREDEGTTFRFTIGLPVDDAPAPAAEDTPAGDDGMHAASRRVLVVDDVDLNREIMVAMLGQYGHSTDVAADGAEAVALAQSRDYDLVFMDIQMPGMDGLAATRAIRKSARLAGLPIVAMTAQALPAQIAACHEAGMNDHLAKPVAPEALAAMIAKWSAAAPEASAAAASGDTSDLMRELRARFIERTRADRTTLATLLEDPAGAGSPDMHALIHRLAGAAGTFGFPDIGDAAVVLDQRFASGEAPAPADYAPLIGRIDEMLQAA